jgi:hypothetical protein
VYYVAVSMDEFIEGTDIYLCGGGIFGSSSKSLFLDLKESLDFDSGFKILTYNIKY